MGRDPVVCPRGDWLLGAPPFAAESFPCMRAAGRPSPTPPTAPADPAPASLKARRLSTPTRPLRAGPGPTLKARNPPASAQVPEPHVPGPSTAIHHRPPRPPGHLPTSGLRITNGRDNPLAGSAGLTRSRSPERAASGPTLTNTVDASVLRAGGLRPRGPLAIERALRDLSPAALPRQLHLHDADRRARPPQQLLQDARAGFAERPKAAERAVEAKVRNPKQASPVPSTISGTRAPPG